ncbi:RHS repeat-associated core domain-containing protein [Marinagarivorans cellulosilyticus]|nr:RHS repeat-associated core domain-containing protein [Marinagarivorans cellulosilyticus]
MLPLEWYLSDAGYPRSGIANEILVEELEKAFATWEEVDTAQVSFEYKGEIDRRRSGIDGYNIVTFTDPDVEFSPGVLAYSFSFSFPQEMMFDDSNNDLNGDGVADVPNGKFEAGTIFDADMVFNSSLRYAVSGASATSDLQAIALHEAGHHLGLTHSLIETSVMYPFLKHDIDAARTLSIDDVAYSSFFYPEEPQFSLAFGFVKGIVTDGRDNHPILGAHVYAVKTETGEKIIGAYTDSKGRYQLPVPPGTYYVGIEPLDGDPIAADPARINALIAKTPDINFPEELFDANESNVEANAQAALPISVVAGSEVANIDFITNALNVSGVTVVLNPGKNYFSYPVSVPEGLTSFELITFLGDSLEINSIERLNPLSNLFERTSYYNGVPSGEDFPISHGVGYVVFAEKQKVVTFLGVPDCKNIDLKKGLNIIGVSCPSSSFSGYELLHAIGGERDVKSIRRHVPGSNNDYQLVEYVEGNPSGDDFHIVNGQAYLVEMLSDINSVSVNGDKTIFPPSIQAVSPGVVIPGDLMLIAGDGFDENILNNIVVVNGANARIVFVSPTQMAVVVPNAVGDSEVYVVTNGKRSNSLQVSVVNQEITEEIGKNNLIVNGQEIRGTLQDAAEQDRYSFIGKENAIVSINSRVYGESADLLVAIEGPSGAILRSSFNNAQEGVAGIKNFRLPETGRYSIVITSTSGGADYGVGVDVGTGSTVPTISVLGGDAQSIPAGTTLPKPIEIYVTGSSGQPLAGVPVTFTAQNAELSVSNGFSLANAGTAVVVTNLYGVATVEAIAPSAEGVYDIIVTVPGMAPVTMMASTIDRPIDNVVVSKQFEDCGGEGCVVGSTLPHPYRIGFFDSNGLPIPNVLVHWKVVSGAGFIDSEKSNRSRISKSDGSGEVEVIHSLGEKLFVSELSGLTNIVIPQVVAAAIPNTPTPLLFGVKPKAGPPANIESLKSNSLLLTIQVVALDAVKIKVTDEFDNPVAGVEIEPQHQFLKITPGLYKGKLFDDYKTNSEGIWVGAVATTTEDGSNLIPTINEFNSKDGPHLAAPYTFTLNAGSVGSVEYIAEVNMGPVMLTQSGNLAEGYITRDLDTDVSMRLKRFQRRDINDGEDSGGDWSDNDFTYLRVKSMEGVKVKLFVRREDGFNDDTGYLTSKVNGQSEVELVTDSAGIVSADVTLGEVAGPLDVVAQILDRIVVQHKTDDGENIGEPIEYPTEDFDFSTLSITALPIVMSVSLTAEQASGIDWSTFNIVLNNNVTVFSGASDVFPPLNTYPHFMKLYLDGVELAEWPSTEALLAGGFGQLSLTYQPKGSDLHEGLNTIVMTADIVKFDGEVESIFKEERYTFSDSPETSLWTIEESADSEWVSDFSLSKIVSLAQPKGTEINGGGLEFKTVGSFHPFHIPLQESSSLSVELQDHNKNTVAVLFDESNVLPGTKTFALLYSDVESRITPIVDKTDMYIVVKSVGINSGKVSTVTYRGELTTTIAGEMLGQVIQHDTLIHSGSLTLRREDLALKGSGPQLEFIRSYTNNIHVENENNILGKGWSHNHDVYLKVLSWSDGSPLYGNNLPGWVGATRGIAGPKLMTTDEYMNIQPGGLSFSPSQIAISNAGVFEKVPGTNVWQGQRGNFGQLTGSVSTGFVYTSKDGTRYEFETQRNSSNQYPLLRAVDRNGNALNYDYDFIAVTEVIEGSSFEVTSSHHLLTRVTDSAGRYLDFSYQKGENGLVRLKAVDANVGSVSAENIRLSFDYYSSKTAEDSVKANAFDVVGMLRSFTRDDFVETYEYETKLGDSQPNLAATIDANQHKTAYQYHDNLPVSVLSFAPGVAITDFVSKVCYPTDTQSEQCTKNSASINYPTSEDGVREVVDLNGEATIYKLNNFGNPIRVEEPEGKITEFDWSIDFGGAENHLIEKRDLSIGSVWNYEYDANGNVTKETSPVGELTQVWHPQFSLLTYRKDQNGNETDYDIDNANGNLLSQTVKAALVEGQFKDVVVSHTYGAQHGLKGLRLSTTKTTDGRSNTTRFNYDQYGALENIIAPGEITTLYENDGRGRRKSETDAEQNTTTFEYDSLDRLTLVTDAKNNTETTSYDDKGNKDIVTTRDTFDINGTVHERYSSLDYEYDARDRVKTITRIASLDGQYNLEGEKTFEYDGNSNITFESDWKGVKNASAFVYDGLNRRVKTSNRAGYSATTSYEFVSDQGVVKSISDFEGRTTVEHYDKVGRLVKVIHPRVNHSDGTSDTYFRDIEYDGVGNIKSIKDEEGKLTTFSYDARNLKVLDVNALLQQKVTHFDESGNVTLTGLKEDGNAALSYITEFEYDDLDRLVTKTEPHNHVWQYRYFDNGNVKSETDPWSFKTSYTYDSVNQLASITDPDGTTNVSFTKYGNKVFSQDAEGRLETYLYGPESRLLQEVDGVGRTTRYTYDLNNNLTDIRKSWASAASGPSLVHTHIEYDVIDQKEKVHDAFDTADKVIAEYRFDKVGNQTHYILPEGRETQFVYDELNRVKELISAETQGFDGQVLNTVTLKKHNGVGNIVWLKDRRENVTSTRYDDLHRVDLVTDSLLQTTRNVYDLAGNVTFQTNKRGITTESKFDELSRVTSQWVDNNLGERFRLVATDYDIDLESGVRIDHITDANGNVVVSQSDFRGNVLSITLPADNTAEFTQGTVHNLYDRSGLLKQTTDAADKVVSHTYHGDGTRASSTVNGSETTFFDYDVFGNVAVTTQPKRNIRTHSYNARNLLVKSMDDSGNVTRFEYDTSGNLTHQFTPAANDEGTEGHVEYVYDALNRKRQHIQHKAANDAVNPGATGNLVSLFGYDAEGNLTHTTDAKGQLFVTSFDVLGRPELQSFPAESDITTIASTFDANNNLDIVTETKAGGQIEVTDHDYDLLDRLEQRSQRGHIVSYGYDNNGNRTSVSAPGGSTVYTFDSRNRLHTTVANDLTSTYHYLQNGWLDRVEQGNGTQATYDYDDAGRTLQIVNLTADSTPAVLSQFDYTFDANGNRETETVVQNGFAGNSTRTTTYSYDNLDRLTGYVHNQGANTESHSFTHYPSYDRKTETVVVDGDTQKDRAFTYDETHWLTSITDTAPANSGVINYQYDNNGNTLRKTDGTGQGPASTVMAYNNRNQLLSVAAGAEGSEQTKGNYDYNYAGMRIRHIGSDRGDIEYIYDDKAIIDEVVNNTSTSVAHYRYGDRLLSLQSGEGEQFYHYSNLGTTANLSDAAGSNQVAYEVDPFGAITRQEGESVNRQVFTGHEHDEETGLIYMKARFYDPDVGRFLSQDTYLGEGTEAPSLHRYLYAYGNPNLYWDPDGYSSVMIDHQADFRAMRPDWANQPKHQAIEAAGDKGYIIGAMLLLSGGMIGVEGAVIVGAVRSYGLGSLMHAGANTAALNLTAEAGLLASGAASGRIDLTPSIPKPKTEAPHITVEQPNITSGAPGVPHNSADDSVVKNAQGYVIPDSVVRRDNNFHDKTFTDEKGRIRSKAYIDEANDLRAVDKDGNITAQEHVAGRIPDKDRSQFISTTDERAIDSAVVFGGETMRIDTKRLQQDINAGKIDAQIKPLQQIHDEINGNIRQLEQRMESEIDPMVLMGLSDELYYSRKNLSDSAKNTECLISPCIPSQYYEMVK